MEKSIDNNPGTSLDSSSHYPCFPTLLGYLEHLGRAPKLQVKKKRVEVRCGVSLFAPPLIYIGGATGVLPAICNYYSSNRPKEPTRECHMEAGGGGAHWAVGRPGWSAGHPVGPPTFPFVPTGCALGPLVIGTGLGFWYVGFLLW